MYAHVSQWHLSNKSYIDICSSKKIHIKICLAGIPLKPKSNEKLVKKKSYRLVSIMIIDVKIINKLPTKIRFSKSTYFIYNYFIYIKFKTLQK